MAKYISAVEVAKHFGLHERTVRRQAAKGLIPSYRGGYRKLMFVLEEVKDAYRKEGANGRAR